VIGLNKVISSAGFHDSACRFPANASSGLPLKGGDRIDRRSGPAEHGFRAHGQEECPSVQPRSDFAEPFEVTVVEYRHAHSDKSEEVDGHGYSSDSGRQDIAGGVTPQHCNVPLVQPGRATRVEPRRM